MVFCVRPFFRCILQPSFAFFPTKSFKQRPELVSTRLFCMLTSTKIHQKEMSPVDTTKRLQQLRNILKQVEAGPNHQGIQAYIVPSEDAHQSEYIAACDSRREFISGFSGSAGFAIITQKEAALWTDGRYFLQASQQLDSNWTLMKSGMPDVPNRETWLAKVLEPNSYIGIDPSLIGVAEKNKLQNSLKKSGHTLVPIKENLVDKVWGKERPAEPNNKILILDVTYTGKSSLDKISELRETLKSKSASGFVVSALDEIAWLFNLRGTDIPCNPVFFSYALITLNEAVLYVHETKICSKVAAYLDSISVKVLPYHSVYQSLENNSRELKATSQNKLLIDDRCNWALEMALDNHNLIEQRSPIMIAKAIKTEAEIQGFRNCHIRDGAAVVAYFSWLENELKKGNTTITEVTGGDYLEQQRMKQENFRGLSFDTISGIGANGAIIHYKPDRSNCAIINNREMYLCDSGAQYLDGTTDITRTLHFGIPTKHEKECFTRVLKGHIAIDTAIFPAGTTGFQLDPFARQYLWNVGLEYQHGTGHGVGSYLNVHEGPQGIGMRLNYQDIPLREGMTVTNEPGYYENGKFGIRIENVLIVQKADTPFNFGGKQYLKFENVTMVPMDRNLLDYSILTPSELKWLNDYHEKVWNCLHVFFEPGSTEFQWLQRATAKIESTL